MILARQFVQNRSFVFYVFLLFAFSSCSSSAFLHRRYTPGEYVDHKSSSERSPSSQTSGVTAPEAGPVSGLAEKKVLTKGASYVKEKTAVSEPQTTSAETNSAGKNAVPFESGHLKLHAFSAEKAGTPKKRLQSALYEKYRKAAGAGKGPQNDPDEDAKDAFKFAVATLICLLVLLLASAIIAATVTSEISAALLLGVLLFLLSGATYIILWVITMVVALKAVIEAKKQKVPVPKKAIIALYIAGIPVLLGLILFLLFGKQP